MKWELQKLGDTELIIVLTIVSVSKLIMNYSLSFTSFLFFQNFQHMACSLILMGIKFIHH